MPPTSDQITAAKAADVSKLDITAATEYLRILKEANTETEKQVELQQRINDLQAQSLAYIKDRLKELEKEQDLLNRSEKAYANRNELLKLHNVLGDNELKILQNQIDLAKQGDEAALAVLKQKLIGNEKLLEGITFTENGNDKLIAQSRIILGLKEKENEAAKRAAEQTKATLSATTGVSDNWKNTLVGSLMEGGEEGIKKSGIAFKETFSAANIAGSLLMKVQESTIMMVKMADTTFATFNKTIGTTGELNNEIYDLSRNNTLLGFTLQETTQAYTALAGGFVDFRGMSKENRIELAQTVTELQAIGISADIATKNISFFSKAMGLSREEIQSVSKELVATAGALEMAPSKIASDFAAAASSIVVYGNRGIEVFKGLEAASKASSVEISNLISIASKMDTFQGAAEVAGRLNAVLGGGLLNSSQLLMASEEERIRLVIESVQSQGVQFNDLDKYTQKAIANAAGITDMAEANKLFGMSVGAYDDYIAKTAASSEEQADLEKRIQASKSAQEKFNYIMQAFAVLVMPILDAVTGLVNVFMKLNDRMEGTLPVILTSIFGLKSFVNNFPVIMKFLGQIYGNLRPIGRFFLSIGRWFMSAGPYLVRFGTFITGLLPSMNTLAAIGTKIATLFTTIGQAIAGLSATAIAQIIVIVAGLLSYLYIIKEVFDSWGDKVDTEFVFLWKRIGTAISFTIDDIADAINNLMKVVNLRRSPSFQEMADHLSVGFTRFANVITSLAIPALNMFMAPLRIIGSIMSGVWSGISTIVGATSQLFGKDNVVGIKANFDATEMLATTAAKITPDSMTNVKQLAAEVQKFNMELKTMAVITASEPLMNLVKAITGQTNAMADGTKDKTIVLKVGEREFGKIVLDTINRKGNIDTVVKSTSTVT